MTEQWRILVVEDEEQLNQNIVNSLRKDGYLIQGVRSGAEAIRMLWSEEFDVVIGDLKTPGADGFELLQWLRTFRPRTRMIMVAATSPNSHDIRTHALEAGVVSYLEKPLNLHLLKEELRRLLQQTGFSANLDSFDLLDVIQIVTMSRK
ncbi:MAG TPA: response regulator, partial [Ktedonobacteraceae bacterium]|nr:response regulator [Ktedonobacteraceae bacterium]